MGTSVSGSIGGATFFVHPLINTILIKSIAQSAKNPNFFVFISTIILHSYLKHLQTLNLFSKRWMVGISNGLIVSEVPTMRGI